MIGQIAHRLKNSKIRAVGSVSEQKIPKSKTKFGTRFFFVIKDLQAKFQNSKFFTKGTGSKMKKVDVVRLVFPVHDFAHRQGLLLKFIGILEFL